MKQDLKRLLFPIVRNSIQLPIDSSQVFLQSESRIGSNSEMVNGLMSSVDNQERQIYTYEVEIQKKYSIPFATIVFVFLGAPLGMMSRRGNFGVSAGMSLLFFVVYWAFLIAGEKLADREMLSPFLAMWLANIILGGIGLLLTYKTSKETVIINWDFLLRLVPKKWISEATLSELARKER